MDIIKLKARPRQGTGKSYTRKARAQRWVPAVYYGHNKETENIEVDGNDFAAIVRAKKTAHLIELGLEGRKDSVAVVKEIQKDVIRDANILHIDFQHVSMDEKITVAVPIEVIGIPIGVKDDGGILGHPVRHLNVECLPLDIPEKIVVDVSALRIGDSIHVRDLKIEKGEIKDSPDEVVALVNRPMKEEEVVAAAPAEGAAAAEGAAVEGAAAEAAPAAGDAKAAKGDKADKGAAKGGDKGGKSDKKDK